MLRFKKVFFRQKIAQFRVELGTAVFKQEKRSQHWFSRKAQIFSPKIG
jgi:hypothetical protein